MALESTEYGHLVAEVRRLQEDVAALRRRAVSAVLDAGQTKDVSDLRIAVGRLQGNFESVSGLCKALSGRIDNQHTEMRGLASLGMVEANGRKIANLECRAQDAAARLAVLETQGLGRAVTDMCAKLYRRVEALEAHATSPPSMAVSAWPAVRELDRRVAGVEEALISQRDVNQRVRLDIRGTADDLLAHQDAVLGMLRASDTRYMHCLDGLRLAVSNLDDALMDGREDECAAAEAEDAPGGGSAATWRALFFQADEGGYDRAVTLLDAAGVQCFTSQDEPVFHED